MHTQIGHQFFYPMQWVLDIGQRALFKNHTKPGDAQHVNNNDNGSIAFDEYWMKVTRESTKQREKKSKLSIKKIALVVLHEININVTFSIGQWWRMYNLIETISKSSLQMGPKEMKKENWTNKIKTKEQFMPSSVVNIKYFCIELTSPNRFTNTNTNTSMKLKTEKKSNQKRIWKILCNRPS